MKLVIDLSANELANLITSCPSFASVLDNQQSEGVGGLMPAESRRLTERESPETLDELESTREQGFSFLENEAQAHGLVARPATGAELGDYIVENGLKKHPVIVVCSKSPRISARKQWANIPDVVVAYVWLNHNRVFLMTYPDALRVLGSKPVASPSFHDNGYYTMICNGRREALMAQYEDNWAIFK